MLSTAGVPGHPGTSRGEVSQVQSGLAVDWREHESAFDYCRSLRVDRVGRATASRTGRAAGSQSDRAADRAAIEKLRQQDIAATFSRDLLR